MEFQQDNTREIYFQEKLKMENQAKNAAKWFYWIAGLSLVNTLTYILGLSLAFVVGLGITQIVDGIVSAISQQMTGNSAMLVQILGFVLNVFIVAVYAVFGYFGGMKKAWAFYVGMALYALDSLIMLWAEDWFGLIFHIFVLGILFKGVSALRSLKKIDQKEEIIQTEGAQRLIEIDQETKAKSRKTFLIFVVVAVSFALCLIGGLVITITQSPLAQ